MSRHLDDLGDTHESLSGSPSASMPVPSRISNLLDLRRVLFGILICANRAAAAALWLDMRYGDVQVEGERPARLISAFYVERLHFHFLEDLLCQDLMDAAAPSMTGVMDFPKTDNLST
jgi:hypothetical protein